MKLNNLYNIRSNPVKKRLAIKVILLMAWILLVFYPNPVDLFTSIYRLNNPPVKPSIVEDLALELKGSFPVEIEYFVRSHLPYSYDWEVYNMPWYFPTLEEALQRGAGDCKARYLLFASLLEYKEIPYQKNISLTHIWVHYDGKKETGLENASESVLVVDDSGNVRLSLPRPDFSRASQSFLNGFWHVMPAEKKFLLFSGFPLIFGLPYLVPYFPGKPALPPIPVPSRVKAQ